MSVTKELIEQEQLQVQTGHLADVHLHKEGTFLRAYEWSAFLCCRYLHEFKVSKRQFKGIDEPVAYIGFPETSLMKWMPEGAEQRVEDEKHLVLTLPEQMVAEPPDALVASYTEWKEAMPLAEANGEGRRSIRPPYLRIKEALCLRIRLIGFFDLFRGGACPHRIYCAKRGREL